MSWKGSHRVETMAEAHTLAVSGLPDQSELLAFASALEARPQVAGIALIRADGEVAVFNVLSASRGQLIEACRSARGFTVVFDAVDEAWDVLEVTVSTAPADEIRDAATPDDPPAPPARTPAPSRSRAHPRPALLSDDLTLPRSRRRVLRGGRRTDAAASSAPGEAPAAARERWVTLDEAIEAVLTDEVPRGVPFDPSWLPRVEVDVIAPRVTAEAVDLERLRLIAAPLRSFEQVNAFRDRLSGLEGVIGLTVGRFYHGALQVTVDYADVIPLSRRLRELAEFAPIAISQRDGRTIQITLDA